MLEIAEGSPALDIHRVAYVADGRRVEFTRSFYRSDTYDFVAELTLPSNARARAEETAPMTETFMAAEIAEAGAAVRRQLAANAQRDARTRGKAARETTPPSS